MYNTPLSTLPLSVKEASFGGGAACLIAHSLPSTIESFFPLPPLQLNSFAAASLPLLATKVVHSLATQIFSSEQPQLPSKQWVVYLIDLACFTASSLLISIACKIAFSTVCLLGTLAFVVQQIVNQLFSSTITIAPTEGQVNSAVNRYLHEHPFRVPERHIDETIQTYLDQQLENPGSTINQRVRRSSKKQIESELGDQNSKSMKILKDGALKGVDRRSTARLNTALGPTLSDIQDLKLRVKSLESKMTTLESKKSKRRRSFSFRR